MCDVYKCGVYNNYTHRSYLVNVVQVVMIKLDGQSINGTPPLHRIVEIRTVSTCTFDTTDFISLSV